LLKLPGVTFDSGDLFVIIHGTQKAEAKINNFQVKSNSNDGASVTWSGTLSYTLFDDFAFSKSDADTQAVEDLIKDVAQGRVQKVKELVKEIGKLSVLGLSYILQKYGSANPYGIKIEMEQKIADTVKIC
jgi:nucleoside-specific outer membrane channel protein Tsx